MSDETRALTILAQAAGAAMNVEAYSDADELNEVADFIRAQAARIAALESELKALREQEPVAWRYWSCDLNGGHIVDVSTQRMEWMTQMKNCHGLPINEHPLYAAPVPAQEDARDAIVEALEIGRDYMRETIVQYDGAYQRHPATEPARNQMLAHLAKVDAAILALAAKGER